MYDLDGDGKITRMEMLEIIEVCRFFGSVCSLLEQVLHHRWVYWLLCKQSLYHLHLFWIKSQRVSFLQAIYKMVGTVIMMRMNEDGLTPQQRVDKIFSKMDKDHNDEITLEEFKEAAKSDPSIVLLLQCDMQK